MQAQLMYGWMDVMDEHRALPRKGVVEGRINVEELGWRMRGGSKGGLRE